MVNDEDIIQNGQEKFRERKQQVSIFKPLNLDYYFCNFKVQDKDDWTDLNSCNQNIFSFSWKSMSETQGSALTDWKSFNKKWENR